jgi:hypothetical protein
MKNNFTKDLSITVHDEIAQEDCMLTPNKGFSKVLSMITIVLGVLAASFLLLFGVANLISPNVPHQYLGQNTRICVMLLSSGLTIIYAIFRPFFGGILVCICGLIFFVVAKNNPLAVPIIFLGMLSIVRGRLGKL